jgi:predicted RNA binding protein YcfA (HicA-like mRNA interferase family)
VNFSLFIFYLKRKKKIQNTTNFPFNVGSKQRQLKSNPKIIINQIDWNTWVCKVFHEFYTHSDGRLYTMPKHGKYDYTHDWVCSHKYHS